MMPIIGSPPYLIPPLDESVYEPLWTLAQPFAWQSKSGKIYVFPAGAKSNLASVPRWVPGAFAFFGARAQFASLCHDILYEVGWRLKMIDSREEADAIWLEIAEETNVNALARQAMWKGIRLAGEARFTGPPDPRELDEHDWSRD